MKLATFTHGGATRLGVVVEDSIVDLAAAVPELPREMIAFLIAGPRAIDRAAAAAKNSAHRIPLKSVKLEAPIAHPPEFLAIGLNYADHAAEAGMPLPKEPLVFNKAPSSISGPNDDTMIPKGSTKLDYEVELGIVIGSRARYLAKDKAMEAVAGYCLGNDVSERVFQIERVGQFTKGKSAETFGPLGPWLVTKDEIRDPQRLDMWLTVNGESRQKGTTRNMVFGVAHVVWYCSQFFVMEPGDVILTGTPPGVGMGIKPEPKFLKAGDVMRLGIDGLGEQQQKVVKFKM